METGLLRHMEDLRAHSFLLTRNGYRVLYTLFFAYYADFATL